MAEFSEGEASAKAFASELKERAALANWLVDVGLASFMGVEGPPLLSPFAAPVRALEAHTKSGLLALRHLSAKDLSAHEALKSLDASQKEKLVGVLLQKVRE